MRAETAAPQASPPLLRFAPLMLLGVTVTALVILAPGGHYALLLAIAPFIAAMVHGAHTVLVGMLTVGLYGALRFWMPPEDSQGVWWIKLGLIVAASAVAMLTNQARQREQALNRTRDVALALQRDLLPGEPPAISSVEIAQRYIPADTEAGVGGDWFDVIPLSGARVALVIGDVVGHGLQAAALMGRLRTAVHAYAELDLAPDELLARMDALAVRLGEDDEARDLAATCLYLVYDPVSRECTLSSAGHTPPALRRPGGSVEFPGLHEHPPLGFGDTAFESKTLTLDEGTVIALYTDGLFDVRRHGTEAVFAHLAGALGAEEPSLPRLCDRVFASVPSDSRDDVALLLARVHSLDPGQVATWQLPVDPRSVSRAREVTARQLDTWAVPEAAFSTELVVSELVTNAIRYASAPITLRLIKDTSLICEVSDDSHTAPHPRRAQPLDEDGRGLQLVAQLTDRWGTRYTNTGKTIWSEHLLRPAGEGREAEADPGASPFAVSATG